MTCRWEPGALDPPAQGGEDLRWPQRSVFPKSLARSTNNIHVSRDQERALYSLPWLHLLEKTGDEELWEERINGLASPCHSRCGGSERPSKPINSSFFPLRCQTEAALFLLPLEEVHEDHQRESPELHLSQVQAACPPSQLQRPQQLILIILSLCWLGPCKQRCLSPAATEKEKNPRAWFIRQAGPLRPPAVGERLGPTLPRPCPEPRAYAGTAP